MLPPAPVLAERPVQDPLRIDPPGLVLNFAAGGQHPADPRAGFEASIDEMAPAYRGRRGGEAGERRARALEEDHPFRELAARRGRCGASELIGGSHSHEEPNIGPRRFEEARQPPVGPRSGFVPDEPGRCEVLPDQGADLVDQSPRRPQPVQESPRRLDPGPVMAGGAEPFGHERLSEIVAENREHECVVVLAAVTKPRCPVESQHGVAPYVALGMPARILGHTDECLDLREEPHEARLSKEVEAGGGAYPEEQMLAKLREHALRRQLREVEPTGKSQELGVGIQLEAGDELRRAKAPQGVFREMRGIGDAEPPRGEVLPAAVGIEDFGREWIISY